MRSLSGVVALGLLVLAGCAERPFEAPVSAPQTSVVRDKVCDPMAFGARADGASKDTGALQAAIDACAADGGGTVALRRGVFLSGTIRLRSYVTLRVEAGATLRGSRDDADYPLLNPPVVNTQLADTRHALVYAESATGVRIEGGGTIDGNADIDKWRGMVRPEGQRPMAIFTALSTDVAIEGITVRDAAVWAVVNMEVEHLVIRGITVDSPHGPTHDGIDVVDGHDVLIEDNTINAGDDGICLKSGGTKGLRDVVVRRNHVRGAGVANGLKLGTATVGPMRNILFEDIRIENAQAAAMAVESVDGGEVSHVSFRRITVSDVGTPVFMLLGARGPSSVGAIHDIRFEAIRGTRLRYPWGALLSGAPADATGRHDLQSITFDDVDIDWRGAGDAAGPHVFGSAAADTARFPVYAGGYPDAKFIFATPTAKSEVIDYALPGFAFFVRDARGVRFDRCRAALDGIDHRDAIATHDAVIEGGCRREAASR
ncbi:MAG: right-handed parallel beta-helix repeat-containing protein [Paucibacter sp.]|nr:right-handed parallel beta-helix repeat-containing protein [Roseateles sp.]